MALKQSHIRMLYIAIFIFALDALSKLVVHLTLPPMNHELLWYPYGGIGIFSDLLGIEFSVVHAVNHGAAWGLFSDHQNILESVRVVLIIGLIGYTFLYNKNQAWDIPLTLITTGALANVFDYFIYGHVVDMFHFVFWNYDYPVFNVADSAIFIGISWIVISSLTQPAAPQKKRKKA